MLLHKLLYSTIAKARSSLSACLLGARPRPLAGALLDPSVLAEALDLTNEESLHGCLHGKPTALFRS